MNSRSIFDIRNANGWILATSIAANMAWSIFSLLIAYYFLSDSEEAVFLMQIAVLLSAFGGPFIIGWLCGWLAFDDRGVTYGAVGALGSVLVILFTFLASGGIAILLSIAALAGGFNGGVLTRYRVRKK